MKAALGMVIGRQPNDPQAISKLNQAAKSTPVPLQSHSLRVKIGVASLSDENHDKTQGIGSKEERQPVCILSKNAQIIKSIVSYLQTINNGLSNNSFVNQGGVFVYKGWTSLDQDVCATIIVDYVIGNSSFTWLGEGVAKKGPWSQLLLSFVSAHPNMNMINDDSKQQQVVRQQVAKHKELPLPAGWSKGFTNDGNVYYKNDVTKTTQWEHPSLSKGK
eukprot:CAMPEP_0197036558 /NCGR_PEP_ID=MMETSP1384-20130603/14032_1 /TAXON_ID=29189 /ORGANISM="Ammonia sp." /LENGTH=217 /DNA_ID=CAMNT_0042466751 /DNA_START=33 /DNA_END=686 /DNA_ORIENTATION=-